MKFLIIETIDPNFSKKRIGLIVSCQLYRVKVVSCQLYERRFSYRLRLGLPLIRSDAEFRNSSERLKL